MFTSQIWGIYLEIVFYILIKYMKCHVAKARANTEWYSFPVRDLTSVNVASLSSKLQLFSLPLPWMYSPFCVSLLDKKKRIETSRGTHEGKAKIIIGAKYWSLSVHLQFLDLGYSTPQVRSSRHKNAMVALVEFLEWLLWSFWQKSCASYFQLSSRCFIWWWNTASHVWYITYRLLTYNITKWLSWLPWDGLVPYLYNNTKTLQFLICWSP